MFSQQAHDVDFFTAAAAGFACRGFVRFEADGFITQRADKRARGCDETAYFAEQRVERSVIEVKKVLVEQRRYWRFREVAVR